MASFFYFTELSDRYWASGGKYHDPPKRELKQGLRGNWKIDDPTAANWFHFLNAAQTQKLQMIVAHYARKMGYAKINPQGRAWERIERQVVDDILAAQIELDDIELGEE